MTADEISGITKKQSQIAVLLDMGMEYGEVKTIFEERKKLSARPADAIPQAT